MDNSVADRCVYSPGDCIDYKYTVIKTLGEGSFGAVYMVESGRQKLALKLLRLWEVPPGIRKDLMERFEMEYKIGQIDCDYLVHSIGRGNIGGNPYIVMEFCTGGDLKPLLGTNDSRIPTVCRQILTGLGALHAREYVHRDLKPENVLFKASGVAALTDFGIAGDKNRRMTEFNILGKPLQIFGTYAYMSPEQAGRARGGVTKDATTDIWSFGVLTYQLLTGEYPFGRCETHDDLPNYLEKAKKGLWDKEKLYRKVQNADLWLRVIDGCLQPKLKLRFQNVEEVIQVLPHEQRGHSFLEPEPQKTRPSGSRFTNYRLCSLYEGHQGDIYDLNKLRAQKGVLLTMGRDPSNSICIQTRDDSFVSRRHCVLEWIASAKLWMIRDGQQDEHSHQWQDSTNGTAVNSLHVNRSGVVLRPGDMITIGEATFKFEAY